MSTAKSERRSQLRRSAGLVLGLVFLSSPAYAYLDPGTGSIILQGLLASVAVAAGFVRMYWHRFKSLFSRQTAQANSGDDSAQSEESEASS